MDYIHYDYSLYFNGCFVLPLIILIFALTALTINCFHYGKKIVFHSADGKDIVTFLIAILIFGFFITLNGSRLIHGGIYLINEKEQDAVTIDGRISQINMLNIFEFPELSVHSENENGANHAHNGVEIIVNHIPCVAIDQGPFEIGDTVSVSYLPKSRYILTISKKS